MKRLHVRMVRNTIGLVCLVTLLLVADRLCYSFTLPVALDELHGQMTLRVGSTVLPLKRVGMPVSLQFVPASDVVHEYQLDGSDSTNNFTLDQTYLEQIASTPYYRFQAWMRDLDGASSWRDLRVRDATRVVAAIAQPDSGLLVNLPASQVWHLDLRLQRPETPRTLIVQMADNSQLSITLDRNDRYIQVVQSASGQDDVQVASAFFPTDALPFAAMVLDFLLRTVLWAIIVLLLILICEFLLAVIGSSGVRRGWPGQWSGKITFTVPGMTQNSVNRTYVRGVELWLRKAWDRLCSAIHPLAQLALCVSCCFVAWIARVQYNAEPHIYDAVAYFFAAKMYALGHLSIPVPLASDRFPGPFMVQYNGRWFAQYPPGTALTFVPGIWLGLPWLVEPVLGTLALLGIGLVAARLYDRRVATLAVILGTLSPFYSYLAASYLSHAVALFYLVWGMWASVRFFQGGRRWNLVLAAGLFGMGALTRDQVGWLFAFCVLLGLVVLSWQRLRDRWRHYLLSGFLFVAVLLLFVAVSLCFNTLLTDSPWVTPRSLFSSGDHWGFGQGIGFYGQHTVAAGLVNLDEQLTALAIDLYGWPFYLTLAFIVLPFLTLRARAVDWFLLLCAAVMTGAFVGYFYHGIYLGPRYLFETLPFLLILTARGILCLSESGSAVRRIVQQELVEVVSPQRRSWITVVLIAVLIGCNAGYFTPRQLALYQNYAGPLSVYHMDVTAVYQPTFHHAIVVTDDLALYQNMLFPLNDPFLSGDVIYALASGEADYQELRVAYPDRKLYQITIGAEGAVQYQAISN